MNTARSRLVKRRILFSGVALLILGVFIANVAPGIFDRLMESIGLTSLQTRVIAKETRVIQINGLDYSFLARPLGGGVNVFLNYTVLSGGSASIVLMSEDSFAGWVSKRDASASFFTLPSRNGTLSFQTQSKDVYYFVAVNGDARQVVMALSLQVSEDLTLPFISAETGGAILLVVGVMISGVGIWNEERGSKSRRRLEYERLVQAAVALGLTTDGKSPARLREEIMRETRAKSR
ncbi:MAG: hypothetical protein HYU39_00765 [Thaumarchaeota archaeon]|nr:hypothetical protein [Nitrososphaerota archaeon]